MTRRDLVASVMFCLLSNDEIRRWKRENEEYTHNMLAACADEKTIEENRPQMEEPEEIAKHACSAADLFEEAAKKWWGEQ